MNRPTVSSRLNFDSILIDLRIHAAALGGEVGGRWGHPQCSLQTTEVQRRVYPSRHYANTALLCPREPAASVTPPLQVMLAARHTVNKLGSPASSGSADLGGRELRETSVFFQITVYSVRWRNYPKLAGRKGAAGNLERERSGVPAGQLLLRAEGQPDLPLIMGQGSNSAQLGVSSQAFKATNDQQERSPPQHGSVTRGDTHGLSSAFRLPLTLGTNISSSIKQPLSSCWCPCERGK